MLDRPEAVAASEPPHWRDRLRNGLLRGIYSFGWRVAARLPHRLVDLIISLASRAALGRDGIHVRTLRRNLAFATEAPVSSDLMRAALRSYLRNFYEVLELPAWSVAEIRRRVRAVNEPVVRDAHAGPGVVVALPHGAAIAGRVVDDTGEPVPGASVMIERVVGRTQATPAPIVGLTDEAGHYRIGGLSAGSVLVSVFAAARSLVLLPAAA